MLNVKPFSVYMYITYTSSICKKRIKGYNDKSSKNILIFFLSKMLICNDLKLCKKKYFKNVMTFREIQITVCRYSYKILK